MTGRSVHSYSHEIQAKSRTWGLLAVALFAIGSLGVRLAYLQVGQHGHYQVLAASQHWSAAAIPAQRGNIYLGELSSDTRFPVAVNDQRDLIYAVPNQMKDRPAAAAKLSALLSVSSSEIERRLGASPTYAVLERAASSEVAARVKSARITGVVTEEHATRSYPEGRLASSVLGFVNGDLVGQYGIERAFQDTLAGRDGTFSGERDSSGVPIVDGRKVEKAPVDGSDVVLALDRNIQQAAETALAASIEKFHADRGSVTMMDPATGRILAMANYPNYDPNSYGEVKDFSSFGNLAVDSPYEPGSIFKVITMASGLDTGKLRATDSFNDTGKVTVSGHEIQNADHKAHGQVDMNYVLAHSLNVGTVYALSKIGDDDFYRYLSRFGFGTATGIELGGEASGSLTPQKTASALDVATMTFGQGITVTPLQMLLATGAIANGGKTVQPHLVDRIIHPDGRIERSGVRVTGQPLSAASAKALTEMMVGVVENGYGAPAKVAGYQIAGKTGTAQIPRSDGKGYEADATIGSFTGFAPAGAPRFVMITRLDRPRGVSFSEEPAAQLWRDVAQFSLNYLGVAPEQPATP